ncbi:MAG: MotA/TolQ/ExbB proton channel family protein [Candidatus Thiodiazotropha sp. (ex Dulcina madagascariensis)]|nr:MotA/TolQ/ExbB proton channel family protein [Candidatus Thiodiazotropha sp. (ex Dulcina madagascariensis)]MCU7927213.1 MotA/TolQ/ExbB proton channel family protein [Candidatus Thiodiazotropha sp. (ex Dulcina madagascariensis)]
MAIYLWIGSLSLSLLLAVSVQLFAPGSGLIAIVSGLFLVVGGTLLTAIMSHSLQAVLTLWHLLSDVWRSPAGTDDDEEGFRRFLQAANFFRRGEIRPAEAMAQRITEPLLRRGTQLVLDGFPRDQISLALQRQIAEDRDHLRRPAEMLRAMSGYAPAFGMLGTLLGLVQMLFGLGSGNLASIGAAMGFAMLTTVYGLVLANLLLKPLASKLEQRGRQLITRRVAHLQAVMMLCDRQHAQLIREMMDEIRSSQDIQQAAVQLRLVASH